MASTQVGKTVWFPLDKKPLITSSEGKKKLIKRYSVENLTSARLTKMLN